MIQHIDEKISSCSISIRTPSKNCKGIHKSTVKCSNIDIDGVHVSKNPNLSQRKEIQNKSDEDCMSVDSGQENVIPVPTFKVEHSPLSVVIKGESKVEMENQKEQHTKLNIISR